MLFVKHEKVSIKTINCKLWGVLLFAALETRPVQTYYYSELTSGALWLSAGELERTGHVCHCSSLSSTYTKKALTCHIPFAYC